jgi:triacylglycerol lipase
VPSKYEAYASFLSATLWLSDEMQYAKKLEANGVSVDLTVMKGMPHPFLAMDAVLEAGKRAISITCDGLNQAFSS